MKQALLSFHMLIYFFIWCNSKNKAISFKGCKRWREYDPILLQKGSTWHNRCLQDISNLNTWCKYTCWQLSISQRAQGCSVGTHVAAHYVLLAGRLQCQAYTQSAFLKRMDKSYFAFQVWNQALLNQIWRVKFSRLHHKSKKIVSVSGI